MLSKNKIDMDVKTWKKRKWDEVIKKLHSLLTRSKETTCLSTVSLWNNLDISIRNSPTLSPFKNRVKADIYKTPTYYNEGPRKLSILHTRLRHQCSSLNADLSKIHIINNFKCNCGASFEDAIHYFLECPLYLNERRTLLSNCDDIDINIETLLFGNDKYSYNVNSKIFGKVRTFINQSKRF